MDQNCNYNAARMDHLLGRQLNDDESKNAPAMLYCVGPMRIPFDDPRVSVIGSRAASMPGLAEAKMVAEFLAGNGVTVVSGLARGIDTEAHSVAMGYGGRTIAVLGTPLDMTYPKENHSLQEEIMRDHLAISQYRFGHRTTPGDFVLRNHTMALVSDGTVVVEAGESGGALYQCRETLRLGRPLFLGRTVLGNESLSWPKKMLDRGAIPLHRVEEITERVCA